MELWDTVNATPAGQMAVAVFVVVIIVSLAGGAIEEAIHLRPIRGIAFGVGALAIWAFASGYGLLEPLAFIDLSNLYDKMVEIVNGANDMYEGTEATRK